MLAAHSTLSLAVPFMSSIKYTSPPPSPRTSPSRLSLQNISFAFIRIRRVRGDRQIVSTSGPEPITHPCLKNAVSTHKVSVSREDQFVCASAVDVPKLLRACRSTLLDQARTIGANVLVEEQYVMTRRSPQSSFMTNLHRWYTSIISPKNRADGPYKVQVRRRQQRQPFDVFH